MHNDITLFEHLENLQAQFSSLLLTDIQTWVVIPFKDNAAASISLQETLIELQSNELFHVKFINGIHYIYNQMTLLQYTYYSGIKHSPTS